MLNFQGVFHQTSIYKLVGLGVPGTPVISFNLLLGWKPEAEAKVAAERAKVSTNWWELIYIFPRIKRWLESFPPEGGEKGFCSIHVFFERIQV